MFPYSYAKNCADQTKIERTLRLIGVRVRVRNSKIKTKTVVYISHIKYFEKTQKNLYLVDLQCNKHGKWCMELRAVFLLQVHIFVWCTYIKKLWTLTLSTLEWQHSVPLSTWKIQTHTQYAYMPRCIMHKCKSICGACYWNENMCSSWRNLAFCVQNWSVDF